MGEEHPFSDPIYRAIGVNTAGEPLANWAHMTVTTGLADPCVGPTLPPLVSGSPTVML
jgi:hypothetical protein